jgi:hypothetical protein
MNANDGSCSQTSRPLLERPSVSSWAPKSSKPMSVSGRYACLRERALATGAQGSVFNAKQPRVTVWRRHLDAAWLTSAHGGQRRPAMRQQLFGLTGRTGWQLLQDVLGAARQCARSATGPQTGAWGGSDR